jgi:MFS transporter, DHA2 family, methylenomycin A resistance protein
VMAIGLPLDRLWVVGTGMVLVGSGIGLLMSPITTAALSAAPESASGQASGIVSTCRQLGGIIGVGVFSAVAAVGANSSSFSGFGGFCGFVIAAAMMTIALSACITGMPRKKRL